MSEALPPSVATGGVFAPLSHWVSGAGRAAMGEGAAFAAGAALARFDLALGQASVPADLLRDRLALEAAEACCALVGRPERAGELRNALHLTRAGDLPGPAGEVALLWRRAVSRPVTPAALRPVLLGALGDLLPAALSGRGPGPVAAAAAIEEALSRAPGHVPAALILGDAALARAMGWDRVVPLLAAGLSRRNLTATGDDLRQACYRAVSANAERALRQAGDLTARAARLEAALPTLRTKGKAEAVATILSRDAIAPSALTPLTDRAARRFCERLVELGLARELTGRASFRLYGL